MDKIAGIAELGSWKLLALWSLAASALMLVLLVRQSLRTAQVKRVLGRETLPVARQVVDLAQYDVLDGVALAPIDHVLPRRHGRFLSLVLVIAIGCWLLGFALAPNKAHFLASPEWLFQPFYIAAHFIFLRMFVNVYTRNFAAGVKHLDVPITEGVRGVRFILGLPGATIAALIAVPFCAFDFNYLFTDRYARMGRDEIVRAIDFVMWGIWCLEWFLNALIWVVLVGFLYKNTIAIRSYAFRAPIDQVLHEKHYRPFLEMSSQGATMVLGFSICTVIYLWFTGGELTDYLGLAITGTLLVIGFVPPWMLLNAKVDHAVRSENEMLRERLMRSGQPAATLEERLDEALALLRLSHLESLYGNLGQTEAKAIMVRLMAPALTIGWQIAQNGPEYLLKLQRLLGAIGKA